MNAFLINAFEWEQSMQLNDYWEALIDQWVDAISTENYHKFKESGLHLQYTLNEDNSLTFPADGVNGTDTYDVLLKLFTTHQQVYNVHDMCRVCQIEVRHSTIDSSMWHLPSQDQRQDIETVVHNIFNRKK